MKARSFLRILYLRLLLPKKVAYMAGHFISLSVTSYTSKEDIHLLNLLPKVQFSRNLTAWTKVFNFQTE